MGNERKEIENIKFHSARGDKIENIMHLINKETLKEQHNKQITKKARGIDNVSKEIYQANLD